MRWPAHLVATAASMRAAISGRTVDFTALEFRLLEYLARNASIVLSRDRILSAVWVIFIPTAN